MISLNDLTYERLQEELARMGLPKYRAEQMFRWFSRGVLSFAQMSDFSKDLRQRLERECSLSGAAVEERFVSQKDGTGKYLLRLEDGNLIESVAMRYEHGITLCLSTQAGCRMGCAFCASTIGGRVRNLTAGEIHAQAALLQRDLGERVSGIVLMGIGEPLDNYGAVADFLHNVNHPLGMGIGYRHIALSTCGLAPQIRALADEGLPVTLSVSLHAPNDALRERLMPVNRSYPIRVLLDACGYYMKKTNRRITFEYILIDGVNDMPHLADELAGLLRGMNCHVNLIPANFVEQAGFGKSSPRAVAAFRERLERRRVPVTVRRHLGSDIDASCGQLRRRRQAEQTQLAEEKVKL